MTKRAQSKLWRLTNWTDNTKRSYPEPVQPPTTSIYRVLNNEVGYYLQGNTAGGGVEDNVVARENAAKADVIMLQGKWEGAFSQERVYIAQLRALRAGLKILLYNDPRYWYDSNPGDGNSNRVAYYTVNTNGAPALWAAKFADGSRCAHNWSPIDTNGVNWCVPESSRNALGQTIAEAFFERFKQYTQWNLYDGVFLDDLPMVAANFCYKVTTEQEANSERGANRDWSYLQNGVNQSVYTDDAFATTNRDGIVRLVNKMRTMKPDYACVTNTDIGGSYEAYKVPGIVDWSPGGRPPTPFSSTNFYELVDVSAAENMFQNRGAFGRDGVRGGYPIYGWFDVSNIFMSFEMQRQHVKNASESYFGRQITLAHQQMPISPTEANPFQKDYDYARACWAMTKLVEGVAYANSRSSQAPFFLDETCIKLGAVINGPRSMGTLNQPPNSSTDRVTFTLRAPEEGGKGVTIGSAKFYWAEFENALVVVRLDGTGLDQNSYISTSASFSKDATTITVTNATGIRAGSAIISGNGIAGGTQVSASYSGGNSIPISAPTIGPSTGNPYVFSTVHGDGAPVTYTLPSAGAGKKWKRPNCATYVNPDYSDLAMQNQSPSLNNGADATTSSLKPLFGEVFLRVPV